ncbi:AMP-binding protein [Lentzea flava]|uniref:Carrier domain-containing protein n=1 Tax=Lentzea flava TaxID=103732 RepID=A0ABQ2ULX7_9PSEU|nr:AMP-binding protein [Lentzea flava]MCP2200648.1 Phosphopantetheine attachment site [Lentzea flava]GGU44197.1 hypothetical protein GCM10010178_40990 [Lentzea flava]
MAESESSHEYLVVLNDEEQYSIWRSDKPLPVGSHVEGTRGGKDTCRDHVDKVWTDVRLLSVRKQRNQGSGFVLVHQKVADRAREVPDRTAVTDQWTSITYGRLVARTEDLAGVLVRRGVRRGDAVAVHLQRGVALVVTLMAVSKAGGTALMLDLAGPEQWLLGFVDRARSVAWITHDESPEPKFEGAVCRLKIDGRLVGDAPETGAVINFPAIGPEDAACLVQTSGSTGEPKLALVSQRTWAVACESQQSVHGIDAHERGAWLFPSRTCVSVSTVIWPFFAAGAHISVPSQETITAPAELAAWIREERITQFFAVAPLAEALGRLEWPPSALRLMLTGSDRVREWGRPDLPFEIANWYGAVEVNTITSSMLPREKRITSATSSAADRAGTPPIGPVWPAVTWWVVDVDDRPVAPGEVGELAVGGRQLAIGYLSPGATAEQFLPDPHAAVPGSRVYRTRDLVRVRPDGALEHCGRADEQVKINGMRDEMAEVEQALLNCPGIREAAAKAVETSSGRAQLVGHVVTDASVADTDLRRMLSDALLPYMVPVAFARMERLPRNRSDKIDRQALPHPDSVTASGGDRFVALAAAPLAEVLDRGSCAPDDNFFLIAGDSLLAAVAARRLSKKASRDVSVEDVLLNPTAQELGVLMRTSATKARQS